MLFAMFLVTLDQPEKITTEPQKAIEGNNVNLTCRATRYLYTDLQWLDSRNQTVTSNVSSLQFSRYSISLSLYLHNVSQNSTAGYKCRAYKLNKKTELKEAVLILDGKLELYMILLFLYETVIAPIIQTFFLFSHSQEKTVAESKSD